MNDFENIIDLIGESGDFMGALSSLLGVGLSGVMLVIAIIGFLLSLVFALAVWVLEAFPLYSIAKKMGRQYAWIAWIPIFGDKCRLWVLSDIAGDKPFVLYKDKYVIKNRGMAFWVYIAIAYLGGAVISAIVGIISTIIPLIGSLSAVLMLIPTIACAYMEYIYLVDVLNIFKEDKKSNRTTAIIVTILDSIITMGFARVFIMYTVMKLNPLPEDTYEAEFTEAAV